MGVAACFGERGAASFDGANDRQKEQVRCDCVYYIYGLLVHFWLGGVKSQWKE